MPLDIEWPGGRLALSERVHVMGIINVTPDSFSDCGRHFEARTAVEAGLRMLAEGADVLDVGGESTRPGSDPVPPEEEKRRVVPVIEGLRAKADALVSVDTRKAEVARAALDAGAAIVNDVSALRDDPELGPLAAERECPVCLMHMKGTPRDMQRDPRYDDLLGEVRAFFEEAISRAESAGVRRERTILDPGIGFGKTVGHNLTLVNRLDEFADLGRPLLVGASRKSFIGKVLGLEVTERLEGTLAVTALAVARGARIIRVHDVKENVRAVRMAEAVLAASLTPFTAEGPENAEEGQRRYGF
jgi:dihydropteroate synthase